MDHMFLQHMKEVLQIQKRPEKHLKRLPDNVILGGKTKDELRQLFMCYAHLGQHGSAHTDYFMECEPATPEQYKDLAQELENIGYNLTIIP